MTCYQSYNAMDEKLVLIYNDKSVPTIFDLADFSAQLICKQFILTVIVCLWFSRVLRQMLINDNIDYGTWLLSPGANLHW